jgi:hypothetical protein
VQAPNGTRIPEDVQLIDESLLWRPPSAKKKAKDGSDDEEGEEEIPMSQLFDLPTDDAFAALPSPTTGDRPTASLDCVELEVDWKEDDDATMAMVNGPYTAKSWSIRDALGQVYSDGSDRSYHLSRLEYFFLMYPPDRLVPLP